MKIVNQFRYPGSNISSTESDVNIRLVKARTAIDRLSIIWKYDQPTKIKQDFFQAVSVPILPYGCTPNLTECTEKKLHEN